MPSHPKKAVKAMEHAFRAGHGNIGKEDRHRLAKETGLTPHQIDGRVFSHVRTALFCTNVMHYDPSGNLIETTCI
uniref:Homeobox domain-containing protein n=1 Tax=Caenorhabditis japonica TaxID=281687 RepID=A0A8R1ILZ5_CAEJA